MRRPINVVMSKYDEDEGERSSILARVARCGDRRCAARLKSHRHRKAVHGRVKRERCVWKVEQENDFQRPAIRPRWTTRPSALAADDGDAFIASTTATNQALKFVDTRVGRRCLGTAMKKFPSSLHRGHASTRLHEQEVEDQDDAFPTRT